MQHATLSAESLAAGLEALLQAVQFTMAYIIVLYVMLIFAPSLRFRSGGRC